MKMKKKRSSRNMAHNEVKKQKTDDRDLEYVEQTVHTALERSSSKTVSFTSDAINNTKVTLSDTTDTSKTKIALSEVKGKTKVKENSNRDLVIGECLCNKKLSRTVSKTNYSFEERKISKTKASNKICTSEIILAKTNDNSEERKSLKRKSFTESCTFKDIPLKANVGSSSKQRKILKPKTLIKDHFSEILRKKEKQPKASAPEILIIEEKCKSKSTCLICSLCRNASEKCTCPSNFSHVAHAKKYKSTADQSFKRKADQKVSNCIQISKKPSKQENPNWKSSMYMKKYYSEIRGSNKCCNPKSSISVISEDGKTSKLNSTNSSNYLSTTCIDQNKFEDIKVKNPLNTSSPSESREYMMEVDEEKYNADLRLKSENNNIVCQEVIVIVDTNVLFEDTKVVERLRSSMFYGKTMKIIIPYIVLQELDKLKTSEQNKGKAQSAIKWCNFYLENDDPCIQGQNYVHYLQASAEFGGKHGDDSIHSCCLLFLKNNKVVYLLSNDVNLRNKAIVSKIRSVSAKKLHNLISQKNKYEHNSNPRKYLDDDFRAMEKPASIEVNRVSPSSLNRTTNKIINTEVRENKFTYEDSIVRRLGGVLEYAMKDAYNDLWEAIVLYKPPWSAVQVLKCFEKHWVAVFTDKFSNYVKDVMKEIRLALESRKTTDIIKKLSYLYELFVDEPYKSIVKDDETAKTKYPGNDSKPKELILGKASPLDFEHFKESIVDVGKHASHILKEMIDRLKLYKDTIRDDMYWDFCGLTQSLEVLRNTLVSFGFLLVRLKEETAESPCLSLTLQLANYWELAQRNGSPFTFNEDQLKSFTATAEGKEFLQLCITDFEKLIQSIDSVKT